MPDTDFIVHGANAETRWEALRGTGSLTPVSKFFVRNHTSTPLLDATSWRLEIHGSGVARPLSLSLRDLRSLPSCSLEAVIECAGNGRSFFTTQQGQTVSGTPGEHVLRARVDGQPDESPYHTQGYLFGAVVRHPVTVA